MPALERLQHLADQARAAAQPGSLVLPDPETEAARQFGICNACRYCEGHCAVFPAMTRRLVFAPADVRYLANLCHHCGACLHACQYAPPHAFAVNLPATLARVRSGSYARYAWPAAIGRTLQRHGPLASLGLALLLALVVAIATAPWPGASADGNFYTVLPHRTMVALFAPVFGLALLALGIGAARCWRDRPDDSPRDRPPAAALAEATHDAVTLHYLDGGHGQGCTNDSDAPTHARRHAHHLLAGGFLLCLASTGIATLYHYLLGWPAPYPVTSLPVLLGTVGGVAMVAGAAGLWRLQATRDPGHGPGATRGLDRGFTALLAWVAASGLALTAGRSSAAMPALLALHLGSVMALFATLPHGKAVHAVYRSVALLRWAAERRRPNPVAVGGE